ncbi:MAG TPA: (d)CMP kinase [Euzebyales bacterium]
MTTVIAIDGPAGSGKSTIAAALADRLGIPHVDTGAFYRALTLAVLRAGADPAAAAAVSGVLDRVRIARWDDRTLLDGHDVEQAIRTDEVTAHVSAVAAHPGVRRRLVALQRAAVAAGGAVVEGRDAASVIVPDATLKVWLTAPTTVRAARRAAQQGAVDAAFVERVATQLVARDRADRPNTFLEDDAVVIDTGDLSVDAVVDAIVSLLPER